MSAPALRISGIRHAYGPLHVLDGIDLAVAPQQTLAVLGPSGCGKSTLLRIVAGFERPDAGAVEIDGATVVGQRAWVPPHRRDMGYVAQDGSLFPHLTVQQNIQFGMERAERRANRTDRVAELLDLVSLEQVHLRRYPHELSGGQQQRVALARALARRPSVVLLDEPFSALDTDLRESTRTAVAQALRQAGVTTILVTHDQGEALSFADELAVMREGRLSQVGPSAEVYERPADAATARLVGAAVFIPGEVLAGASPSTPPRVQTVLGLLDLRERVAPGPCEVLLRPEQLVVEAASAGGAFEVAGVHYFGHDHLVDLRAVRADVQDAASGGRATDAAPARLRARVPGDVSCSAGDRVSVSVQGPVVAFRSADQRT